MSDADDVKRLTSEVYDLRATLSQLRAQITELEKAGEDQRRLGRSMYTDEQIGSMCDKYCAAHGEQHRQAFMAGFGAGVPAGERWAYRDGLKHGRP
jgi:hypothetical protein